METSDFEKCIKLWNIWIVKEFYLFFQVPPQSGQQPPFKLNIVESIERIKEEFNFLQAQYHK